MVLKRSNGSGRSVDNGGHDEESASHAAYARGRTGQQKPLLLLSLEISRLSRTKRSVVVAIVICCMFFNVIENLMVSMHVKSDVRLAFDERQDNATKTTPPRPEKKAAAAEGETTTTKTTTIEDNDVVLAAEEKEEATTFRRRAARCGEILPELEATSDVTAALLEIVTNDPPVMTKKHGLHVNSGSHTTSVEIRPRLMKQTCLYDTLTRWNELTEKLGGGMKRWVVHGGSAMGAKCHGGMNPWDDDIDLTVHDCTALDEMWENGDRNITRHYPTIDERSHSMHNGAAIWDPRLLDVDGTKDMILTRGDRCCSWYKLFTVQEAMMWKPGDAIGGIDIECKSRRISMRERETQSEAGWHKHLAGNSEILTVPFGPTTVQVMDPGKLNRYFELRYGKVSPCQFPFSNGQEPEKFPLPPASAASAATTQQRRPSQNTTTGGDGGVVAEKEEVSSIYRLDRDQSQMDFALRHWYVPRSQRSEWLSKKGDGKQMEYTSKIPNLDEIEIDNTINPDGCSFGGNNGNNSTLKVIGWNAERGTYWDVFADMVPTKAELKDPDVVLLNEMDVGMARSGNVHTARRLAIRMGMNYAYGVEFLELTRGTKEEQNVTEGRRDALSLHGNAILSRCVIGDAMILRDELPRTYFSSKPERGINADGYEVRLGGRMGLFARIFESPAPDNVDVDIIPEKHESTTDSSYRVPSALLSHYVVGNVHKVEESEANRRALWSYYGFGPPPSNGTKYDGNGIDLAENQKGVIVQGDFGPKFCSLGGLKKMNNYRIHKTFRVECLPDGKSVIKPLAGDFFCSNMKGSRGVKVTPSCDWTKNSTHPITLADHAIVSIEVKSNKD